MPVTEMSNLKPTEYMRPLASLWAAVLMERQHGDKTATAMEAPTRMPVQVVRSSPLLRVLPLSLYITRSESRFWVPLAAPGILVLAVVPWLPEPREYER